MSSYQYFDFVDHVYGRTINEENYGNLYMTKASRFVLCEKLKSICYKNGKEKNKLQGALILHKIGHAQKLIGDCYNNVKNIERLKNLDKVAYIRSAVLLNAAIARKPDNVAEIESDLQKLCFHVLQLASAKNKTADLVKEAKTIFQEKVRKMRDMVSSTLNEIPLLDKGEDVQSKLTHAKKIETLQWGVTEQFTCIMNDVMKYCVNTMGPAHCKYALAGMGSLPRREITPQSDFENIILLEDGIQNQEDYEEILEYFRWVATLFQIILVNFGETIVRFMVIPGLNNPKNWYYDDYTPCGICPDGYAWKACKNSLGRQEYTRNMPWKTEFIKPVSEMLKYLCPSEDMKNGCHLADMLRATCFVSGHEEVHTSFQHAALRTGLTICTSSNQDMLKNAVLEFNSFHGILFEEWKLQMDIKRIVYRSITVFLSILGRHYRIETPSSFDIVRSLPDILPRIQPHLLCAVATACEARLRAYCSSQHQDDMIQYKIASKGLAGIEVEPRGKVIAKMTELVGRASLFWYFKSAFYLQLKVTSVLDCDIDDPLFDKQLTEKQQNFESKLFDIFVKSYAGLHTEVIKDYENSVIEKETFPPNLIAAAYLMEMRVKDAKQHIESALKRITENEANINTVLILNLYLSICYMKEESYLKGLNTCKKVLALLEQYPGTRKPSDLYIKGMLYTANFITGVCHFNMNNFSVAEKYFAIAQSLPPDKLSIHVFRAEGYAAIARCKFHQGDVDGSMTLLWKELNQRKMAANNELVDPDLATCYASIGLGHMCKGNTKEGMQLYAVAQHIFEANGDPMWQRKAAYLEVSQLWSLMTDPQSHEDLKQLVKLFASVDSALARYDRNCDLTRRHQQSSELKEVMATVFKLLPDRINLVSDSQGTDKVCELIDAAKNQMDNKQYVTAMVNFKSAQILWGLFEVPYAKRNNAECYKQIAECLQQLGSCDDAIQNFKKELQCIGISGEGQGHEKVRCLNDIGHCYSIINDSKNSTKHFEMANKILQRKNEDEEILKQANVARKMGKQ